MNELLLTFVSVALQSAQPAPVETPQVFARLGDFVIFAHEVGDVSSPDAMTRCESLLDELLIAHHAASLGLDQEPALEGQLRALETQAAARAYLAEKFSPPPPSDEELWLRFQRGAESIELQRMSFTSRETAELALERLKSGEPFDDVAKALDEVGDFGKNTVQRIMLPEGIAVALDDIAEGTSSDVIDTPLGPAIFRVVRRFTPTREQFTKERLEATRRQVRNQQRQQLLRHYTQKRRVTLEVEVNEEVLTESGNRLEVPDLNTSVVAHVGDRAITYADVIAAIRQVFPNVRENSHTNGVGVKRQILERLLEQTIIEHDAREQGYVDRPEVQAVVQPRRRELVARALRDRYRRSPGAIEEEDLETFYEREKLQFRPPRTYHLRHILLPPGEAPDDAVQRALRGEDFSELAEQLSVDTASAEAGGRLPPLDERQLAQLGGTVLSVLRSTRPGMVATGTSQFGTHVMLIDRVDTPPPPPMSAITDRVHRALIDVRTEASWEAKKVELRRTQSPTIDFSVAKQYGIPLPTWVERGEHRSER